MESEGRREDWVDLQLRKEPGTDDFHYQMEASSPRAALHGIAFLIMRLAQETDTTVMQLISCMLEDITGGTEG